MPKGFTLWFTGLSGSGKSTLANKVAQQLTASGRLVDLLDGDVVRQHLCKGLGFSKEDRDTNVRRIGFVAHLITKHGGVAVTAAISPYRKIRDENRTLIGDFVEVYCECSLEECERRDVKGLYAKARKAMADGNPMGFTGVDDPYEAPEQPEITVDTAGMSEDECLKVILSRLQELEYLDENVQVSPKKNSSLKQFSEEHIPDELVLKAEELLRAAGLVHTRILMQELHVGFETAARLIDRMADRGLSLPE